MADTSTIPTLKSPVGWRFITFFLGLLLATAGGLFTWLLWVSYQRGEETRAWPAVPCEILTSRLDEEKFSDHSPLAYRPVVKYSFIQDGQSQVGTKIRRVDGPRKDRQAAEEIIKRFTVGSSTTCYVPPGRPAEAILVQESRAALYSIWFPALFVAGGLGIAVGAFKKTQRPNSPAR